MAGHRAHPGRERIEAPGRAEAYDDPSGFLPCSDAGNEVASVLRAASYSTGGAFGDILGAAANLVSGGEACTQPNPSDGPTAGTGTTTGPRQPGEVTSQVGGAIGSIFQCPNFAPILHCDWTGWCWCAAY